MNRLSRIDFALFVIVVFAVLSLGTLNKTYGAAIPTEGSPEILNQEDLKKVTAGCSQDPFPILRQHYKPGAQSSREGPDGINKLNADFACRLSKLIAAYPAICINSAYRSNGTQAILWQQALAKYGSAEAARKWVAPPGGSMHNKGLAADLCNVPDMARTAVGRFGLTFRMGHEPWHIEPSGSVTGDTPSGADATQTTPSSALFNAARNFFNPTQQQPLQQQQQMCALPGGGTVPCSAIANPGGSVMPGATSPQGVPPSIGTQNSTPYAPGTCAPQFYCQNNNLYYRSSSCVDQVNQICPKGCSGTSCTGGSQTSDFLSSALSDLANPTTTEKKATSSLSAFDQISLLVNPTPVGAPATPAPLVLNVNGEDATRLTGTPPPGAAGPVTLGYGNIPPGSQQTFTSGDLSAGFGNTFQDSSAARTTLAIMRETLLRVLDYLRPFGRPASKGVVYNEFGE